VVTVFYGGLYLCIYYKTNIVFQTYLIINQNVCFIPVRLWYTLLVICCLCIYIYRL